MGASRRLGGTVETCFKSKLAHLPAMQGNTGAVSTGRQQTRCRKDLTGLSLYATQVSNNNVRWQINNRDLRTGDGSMGLESADPGIVAT